MAEERRCVVCGEPILEDHETVMRTHEAHMCCESKLHKVCTVRVQDSKWEPRNPDKYGCPTVPSFYGCLGCEMIGKCYTLTGNQGRSE